MASRRPCPAGFEPAISGAGGPLWNRGFVPCSLSIGFLPASSLHRGAAEGAWSGLRFPGFPFESHSQRGRDAASHPYRLS